MTNSKKILFIDDDNFQNEARAQLLIDTREHVVIIVDSFEEVKILYQKDKFDIVIIDFALDFGEESLRYIESIDPMQTMIMISENEGYSEQKGCDFCVQHHRRRRLIPPFAFPELVRLIENFDLTICSFKNKF
jgi:DNA-binding NtrC family response regulator